MSSREITETQIVGESLAIEEILQFIKKVAKSEKNVLIFGETGTGKDLIARKIHELSYRRHKPFIAINCANIPEQLFEAELFGYVRGSFTGAFREKAGLLEIAEKGTVFLDEIGDLTLHLQVKILRLIDNKEIRRIGETTIRHIDIRFIFATNKDLQEEVSKGRFRKDLYYRISVMKFYIPPLRDRKEDMPLLINNILKREEVSRNCQKGISTKALKKLMQYNFPGNIRELENIIDRAFIFAEGDIITEKHIKFDQELSTYRKDDKISAEKLRAILEKCRWNKTKAAGEIGKSRRQFYRLLKKYQITDCVRRDFSI
jgi:transcriptional regulator with GAF, ATPase, and Fis domain